MATRGSIPKMMEMAGIEMLPPEAGIPVIRRELVRGTRGEVVVGGMLGALLEPRRADGGLDAAKLADGGPMIGRAARFAPDGALVVETTLDPREQPFLDHHRIDGTAVLPGAMGIEAFAELAHLAFPDRAVAAVEDVAFLAPCKFYRDEPRTLTLEARFEEDGPEVLARCRLVGTRTLAARPDPETTVHFTAVVRLGQAPSLGSAASPPVEAPVIDPADIYRVYFHGPAYRVLAEGRTGDGLAEGRLADPLPADRAPESSPLAFAPRLIELAFQIAGIYELATEGRMGLPRTVAEVRVRPGAGVGPGVRGIARPTAQGFEVDVADADGRSLVEVRGYATIALPETLEAGLLAPFRPGAIVP